MGNASHGPCTGRHFKLHKPGCDKPLYDLRHAPVQAQSYRSLTCQRTFPDFPHGVSRAQQSSNLKALSVLLYVLGVSDVFEALGQPVSTSSACNNVQAAGTRAIALRGQRLQQQGASIKVLASDLVEVSAGTAGVSFNEKEKDLGDNYGHGTHVAGIIAGNGANSNGMYIGVSPGSTLYSLKIADKNGQGTTQGMLLASRWLLLNHAKYNIRVVNMSFSSEVVQSYHVDPVDAAVELLWMNGIVVVVSVGNTGPNGAISAPGNDPYAIAVGATDDKGTDKPDDDTLAVFSSYGTIENGIAKPDLVAPGRHIISVLASMSAELVAQHHTNVVGNGNKYFIMSGTSMASPMVAGTVALLLQAQPLLTPNQVKGCLIANAAKPVPGSKAKYVKADDVAGWDCSHATSNQSVPPSLLLVQLVNQLATGGLNLGTVNWGNVNWGNVNWGNVNWGNVEWDY